MEERIAKFIGHYEAVYYRYSFTRLQCCKSQFHLLAHIGECMRWLGPPRNYAQWTMERVCGLLGPKVMSRSQANRNLSLAILKGQQLHYIPLYLGNPFQIDGDDSESDSDSDSDADDSTDSEADTNTSNKYVNYSVIMAQLQATKGHTTFTSKSRGHSMSVKGEAATLYHPKPDRIKLWERTLTQKYLERSQGSHTKITMLSSAHIQLWKT